MRHRLLPILLLSASLGAQSPLPAPRPVQREVLRIATRTSLVQPCLLLTESVAPRAVAILIPGGAGAVRLDQRSIETVLGPRGNFLIRSAEQFLSPDLAVAIMDCPSDRPTGMDDEFRSSAAHTSDVRALLDALRSRFRDARFFLVGTSRGTVSAGYVALALGTDVAGVVLTSSVFRSTRSQVGLSFFPFEKLKTPLLVVHHAEDGCPQCPYGRAVAVTPKAALITVRGGIEPESGPCDPLSNHGYFGREAQVSQAIRAWILGQPFEREIP